MLDIFVRCDPLPKQIIAMHIAVVHLCIPSLTRTIFYAAFLLIYVPSLTRMIVSAAWLLYCCFLTYLCCILSGLDHIVSVERRLQKCYITHPLIYLVF